ncbi:uncharacterized protein LOC122654483 [Telopea speciosissima]|uniref:uncharacterized protein LOC122654483 n=1 Tax=Telopea speciosissima TaxID=54955 RepID=UPI001CC6390F|nr:uncharacterized protein LOC122654483 [Telopea speciosissima]
MDSNGEGGNVGVASSGADNGSIAGYDPFKDPKRKAKSNDPGWKYGYWPDLTDKNLVKCNLCKKDLKGGIKRIKQHLVGGYGDVAKCTKTTAAIAQEMNAALMSQSSSKVIPSSGTAAKRKRNVIIQPPVRGPMDAHVRQTPEQEVADKRLKGRNQTTIENRMRSAEEKKRVDNHIVDWLYECGIPFNALKSRSFEVMIESVAQYRPGYRPPTYHEARVPLLKSAKERTAEMKKTYEGYWKQFGCTLMSDGWTDKKGRHLINFLVNCPEGTYFMGSVDASSYVQDANTLFQLLDSKVEEIGEEYVVQVVTDNAANYKAAGALLMEKRTRLYWTPCAAHCIDLMLEDIGNLKAYKKVIVKARKITTFIYRHTHLLDAMRAKTNGRDLVRAAVTRFATSFLTLQSLLRHKDDLRHLFISDDWKHSNLAKTKVGKKVAEKVFAITFWNGVEDCIRASKPLIVVLRIVDADEKPALPEVYVAMEEAKKMIKKNFGDKERLWKKVINIVNRRWECQMERLLYAAALFLNPGKFFQYSEAEDYQMRQTLQTAFNQVTSRLVPDPSLQDKILHQAGEYRNARGLFSSSMAIRQRTTMNPSK